MSLHFEFQVLVLILNARSYDREHLMQRKATKQSRGPNTYERKFIEAVKELPCICCGREGPSIVDHIYGSSKKLYNDLERVHVGHMAILPLCVGCDSVKTQGSRREFEQQFGKQEELWLKMLDIHGLIDRVPENVRLAVAGEARLVDCWC